MIADVFRSDPKYVENEAKYEKIKRAILGGDSDDEEGGGDSGSEGDTEEGDDSEEERYVSTLVCFATEWFSHFFKTKTRYSNSFDFFLNWFSIPLSSCQVSHFHVKSSEVVSH